LGPDEFLQPAGVPPSGPVELFANLTSAATDPGAFAAAAEEAGFDGVTCSDHFWLRRGFPHLWVSLAAMACATQRVAVASSFANNLFRSPVEFVQASLSMQHLSGGRFEAGLGAGWTAGELEATGQTFPDGRTRARRYREALQVARQLFETGGCQFSGEHYTIDVPRMFEVLASPPPLVASVGSPWTMRNITPLVDRVELKFGRTTRGGALDMAALASVTHDELASMVRIVREVRPDIGVGLFTMIGVGDDPQIGDLKAALGDNLCGSFVGSGPEVLDHLLALEQLGVDRVQITELIPDSTLRLGEIL
jgi:alkanesulfonate monooxygenase SsuD/methylene tetrahydromethanopterin reductase-like flavin-dependent oxidoreductase (luciferase family)